MRITKRISCEPGIAVLAFGAGVILANFLPNTALVIIEAGIIFTVGLICFIKK